MEVFTSCLTRVFPCKRGNCCQNSAFDFGIDSASVKLVCSDLVRLEAEPGTQGLGLVLASDVRNWKGMECPALCGLEGDGWSCPVWLCEPGDNEVKLPQPFSVGFGLAASAFVCGLGFLALSSPCGFG